MQEMTYLSIAGVKKPLYEYCRMYGIDTKHLKEAAKVQGMPISKVFCDKLLKKGINIDRKTVIVTTAFDYDDYLRELEGRKVIENAKREKEGKRFNVEYFKPYGSAAGEWKAERNINSARLNEIASYARCLSVEEVKR